MGGRVSCTRLTAPFRQIRPKRSGNTSITDYLTAKNSAGMKSSWTWKDGRREREQSPPRGATTNTDTSLSRASEYLHRCCCCVLQVQSCRCDYHQKTSHWKTDRSTQSTPISLVLLIATWDNASLNGIMHLNSCYQADELVVVVPAQCGVKAKLEYQEE